MQLLNLRNKILGIGLLILLTVTSFNLYYTFHIFKEDKESYIFENVLRNTELVARELDETIDSIEGQNLQFDENKFDLKRHQKLSNLIQSDKIFTYDIIKDQTSILGNSEPISISSNNNDLPYFVKEIKHKEQTYLVGYVKNKKKGLATIAYISKNKAFVALTHLTRKNLYFSIIIFGFVLILTIIFARSITNPILKIIQKTVDISNGDYDSQVEIKSNDELKILGESINSMSRDIKNLLNEKQNMILQLEKANEQLDIYSKDLERLVDERTAELKDANSYITAMVNSLTQGLFVIKEDGTCSNFYTSSCSDFFGSTPESKEFSQYIEAENSESIEQWLKLTFMGSLPFESCAELGPSHYSIGEVGEDNFKYIKLEYYPLMMSDDLKGIVVLATNLTDGLILEADNQRKQAYINRVVEFVTNQEAVKGLVNEAYDLLDEIIEIEHYEGYRDRALMVFHTINGGFGTFSFKEIQEYAISCEDFIQSNEDNDKVTSQIKEQALIVKALIEEFYQDLHNKFINKNQVTFDIEDINYLSKELSLMGSTGDTILHNFLNHTSITALLRPYPILVKKISDKLEKPMQELIIPSSDIRVEPQKIQEFTNSLVHVFKNSLDHGIEISSERMTKGKSELGKIEIDLSEQGGEVTMTITDDGAGIDIEAIKNKISKNYDESYIESLSQHEILEKIFDPNFSTRDNVSELSGRGIGMSAVKDAIDKIEGSIKVESTQDQGTKFKFSFRV